MTDHQMNQIMQAINELSAQIKGVDEKLSAEIRELRAENAREHREMHKNISGLIDMYGRHEIEIVNIKREIS